MFLHLFGINRLALSVNARSNHVGALVHVGKQKRGANTGLRVETRATVPVPTRADLEVERAVNSVLLRPENRRQVLRHR